MFPKKTLSNAIDTITLLDTLGGAEIMVIIGNPPYNVGQLNENDNNKNRVYPKLDQCIRETYSKDSQATLKNQLYDMYVRFFRWATDQLEERDGIVCFVTNNGFLDGVAFDGFRKHIAQDFTHIYHFNCKGNARTSGKQRRREGGNIFSDQIRVGVGITLLIRNRNRTPPSDANIYYHCVDDYQKSQQKREYLASFSDFRDVSWQLLMPNDHHTWLTDDLRAEFDTFIPMGTKEAKAGRGVGQILFRIYSAGINTSRDAWVYDFDAKRLTEKMQRFIENYNYEVLRASRQKLTPEQVDSFINPDGGFLKWTDRLKNALLKGHMLTFEPRQIRQSLYRPFCRQVVYFDHLLAHRRYLQHYIFPTPKTEKENVIICVTAVGSNKPFHSLMTNCLGDYHLTGDSHCFPFYTYDEDGTNRQDNITDWALARFQARCGDQLTKWDIFYYVYAMLHHPAYREYYAENLKRDLPHIPLPTSAETFAKLATAGQALADLHVHYEQVPKYQLEEKETQGGGSDSWRIEKMKLSQDKQSIILNPWLTLEGIPSECFYYQLGNRSALEWVIEQYQVTTDPRSGIVNDPNRLSDHNYIVDLVKRVVYVSVETQRMVNEIVAIDL